MLNPAQVMVVQSLIHDWRKDGDGYGPRPNVAVLEHVMWIMIGTSARIGEVLGLRRCDVDVTSRPATVPIAGTIKQSKANGLYRKNTPKRSRQKRRVALPSFSAAAIRRHRFAQVVWKSSQLLRFLSRSAFSFHFTSPQEVKDFFKDCGYENAYIEQPSQSDKTEVEAHIGDFVWFVQATIENSSL